MAYIKCLKGLAHVIPNGKTVTPVNDVQIWLHCANIWDKSYTTLSEVWDDDDTTFALMTTDNAIDYMVRSTSWINTIVYSTGYGTRMGYIGAYDYAASAIIGDASWRARIRPEDLWYIENESNPYMTSDTAPKGTCISDSVYSSYSRYKAFDGDPDTYWCSNTSNTTGGQYIGYKFGSKANVFIIQMYSTASSTSNAKVQYSDDGSSWSDTGTTFTITNADGTKMVWVNDSGSHKYWRVYCTSSTAASRFGTYSLKIRGRDNGGVQDWLRAGGITNKKYTTLAEVFNDSTTLNTLLTSNSAWDYIVTAKGFIDQDICENQTFMTALGNSNYAANLLLNDEDWYNAIKSSTYASSVITVTVPKMTGDTTPSGEAYASSFASNYQPWKAFSQSTSYTTCWSWSGSGAVANNAWLAYDFGSAVRINGVMWMNRTTTQATRPAGTLIVQGSNDKSTWVDVSGTLTGSATASASFSYHFTNTNAYRHYRVLITSTAVSGDTNLIIQQLQFYGRQDV